jgi:hypothetical protein
MAWTSPKTWSFGEVLSSSDMNTYVRDNTADLDARVDAASVVKQVVTSVFDAEFSTTAEGYQDTGLQVSITPSSSSSLVLVIATAGIGNSTDQSSHVQLVRGSTPIGNSAGGENSFGAMRGASVMADGVFGYAITVLDNPETTGATVYKVRLLRGGGTGYLNRSGSSAGRAGSSSITAIEVSP